MCSTSISASTCTNVHVWHQGPLATCTYCVYGCVYSIHVNTMPQSISSPILNFKMSTWSIGKRIDIEFIQVLCLSCKFVHLSCHMLLLFFTIQLHVHVPFYRRSTSWEAVNKVRCMLRTVVKDLPPPRSRVPWRSTMGKQIAQRYMHQQVKQILI